MGAHRKATLHSTNIPAIVEDLMKVWQALVCPITAIGV
jgi:hypothetical protein